MENKQYASGKIIHRELCQLTDFSNLRFELKNTTISPTDIDGCKEYKGIFGYMLELKYGDVDINQAQTYTFTTMTDALNRGGYNGGFYTIVANHNNPANEDIDAGNAIVRKVYWFDVLEGKNGKGRWKLLKHKNLTVKQVVAKLMKSHKIK